MGVGWTMPESPLKYPNRPLGDSTTQEALLGTWTSSGGTGSKGTLKPSGLLEHFLPWGLARLGWAAPELWQPLTCWATGHSGQKLLTRAHT